MDAVKMTQKAIAEACRILKQGGVIVFPTDTVYGFLADASNKKAVVKIFKIKKRPKQKPLALFVKDFKMAKQVAKISSDQEKILKSHWPGAYTFVLKSKIKSKLITKNGGIALRIPAYKPLNKLLSKVNFPLAQTSANISGKPQLYKIKEILEKLEAQIIIPDLVVGNGDLPRSKPSSIIDLTKNKNKVLRK